jgi:hypothetical protein
MRRRSSGYLSPLDKLVEEEDVVLYAKNSVTGLPARN